MKKVEYIESYADSQRITLVIDVTDEMYEDLLEHYGDHDYIRKQLIFEFINYNKAKLIDIELNAEDTNEFYEYYEKSKKGEK